MVKLDTNGCLVAAAMGGTLQNVVAPPCDAEGDCLFDNLAAGLKQREGEEQIRGRRKKQ